MSGIVAAITGGAGFIGRHLAAALLAQGDEVRILDAKPRPAALDRRAGYAQGSILDDAACRAVFSGAQEIYHVAGLAHLWARDPAQFHAVNVEGTRTVLEAARGSGVARVIVTSTETILCGWRDRTVPLRETDRLPPAGALAGPYTRSKALAHALARDAFAAGEDIRVVYPTVPVGAGDEAFTSPTAMIRDFLSSPPPAYLDCRLNLVDVGDVARGHILAARRGAAGGCYILGGEDLWMHEILALLARISGRPMPGRRIPYGVAHLAGVVSTFLSDHVTHEPPRAPLEGVRLARNPREISIDRARATLGYAPRPVETALASAVDWLIAGGYLAKGLDLRPPEAAKKAP